MRYKIKEKNINKLKTYLNADTKTEAEREAKRFYIEMRSKYIK
jgi:hypothetical protein